MRRFKNTVFPSRASADFDEEARFHFERRVEDYLKRGLSPEDAKREAARRLGGLAVARERTRDVDTFRWLADLTRDVEHAGRTVRTHPMFTIVAVLTLAVGVGLNAAVFMFADALIFRPPDLPRAYQLVRVFSSTKGVPLGDLSYPDYQDLRRRTAMLSGLAGSHGATLPFARAADEPGQMVGALITSGNYFRVLGVKPVIGQGFRDADDRPGRAVTVISYELWQQAFQGDPTVIGREIRLAGRPMTVIGVAPAHLATPDLRAIRPDVYLPLGMADEVLSGLGAGPLADRGVCWLTVTGRLQPGTTAARAGVELTTLGDALAQAFPDTDGGRSVVVLPLREASAALNPVRQQTAMLLLGLAGLVLLIACGNVANLLLSHAAGRTKEVAIRLALGASRGRLVRQLLAECLVLAAAGGVAGLVLAYAGTQYLSAMVQSILAAFDVSPVFDLRVGPRVVTFTALAAFATLLLSGLTPALRGTRVDLVSSLKALGATDRRRRRVTLRGALVATQIAFSVVVLTVAGLSIGQAIRVRQANPGFQIDHVLLATFDPTAVGYDERQAREFFERVVSRTQTIAGIRAVGLTQDVPLISGYRFTPLTIDGVELPKGQDALSVRSFVVDPGFWTVLRTPIVRGRAFDERDTSRSLRVAIVNETMAQRYWPNRSAVGQTMRLTGEHGGATVIVGVAENGKYGTIAEPPQPAIFLPFAQQTETPRAMTMLVLTSAAPEGLVPSIRTEASAIDARLPPFNVRTLKDDFARIVIGQQLLVSKLTSVIGLLGTILTIGGLYGVVAYLTALRTREIGIRMALGASRRCILWLVLQQAGGMLGAGITAGIGLAAVLMPAFTATFSFVPHAATIVGAAAVLLVATACAAAAIPARRAATLAPVAVLRDQ